MGVKAKREIKQMSNKQGLGVQTITCLGFSTVCS